MRTPPFLFLVCLAGMAGCNNSSAPKGGIDITVPGVEVNVDQEGVKVKAPGTDVKAGKDGVKVDAPGAKVDVNQ